MTDDDDDAAERLATRHLYEQIGAVDLLAMRRAFEADRRRAVNLPVAWFSRDTIEFCDRRIALIDDILATRT